MPLIDIVGVTPGQSQPSPPASSSSCGLPHSKEENQENDDIIRQTSPQLFTSNTKPETAIFKTVLRIIGSVVSYLGIWNVFLLTELVSFSVHGHCHIIHFTDGTY